MIIGHFIRAAALVVALVLSTVARADAPLVVDFTDYRGGAVEDWLRAKGFNLESDAGNRQMIALSADANGLKIDTLKQARGFLTNRRLGAGYGRVEIEWGVSQFPAGASYEKSVNNEAIMVHVFFGAQKVASGSFFAPDVPYFLGLFLCRDDRVNFAYTGRYYTQSGRYICLDRPRSGAAVRSQFDLKQSPRAIFGAGVGGDVSGFAISVDTTSSQGASSAFIRRIKFLPGP